MSGSGTWNASPDTTYASAWARCDAAGLNCTAIPGATNTLYVPVSADAGHTLILTVTATNPDGTASASSKPSPLIIPAAPRWTALPIISADPGHIGDALTVTPGTWSGPTADTDTVQMMSCTSSCAPVGQAGASRSTIATSDLGAILRVRETATNRGGSTVVWSARYVGPVISAAAGEVVLKEEATVAVGAPRPGARHCRASEFRRPARRDGPGGERSAHRAAPRSVKVKRSGGVSGALKAWVCPVPANGSAAPPKCTAKTALTRTATIVVPASLNGRLGIVVIHAKR